MRLWDSETSQELWDLCMECLGICVCGLLGNLRISKKYETCVGNINGPGFGLISGMARMEREKFSHFNGAKRIAKTIQEGVEKGGGHNHPAESLVAPKPKAAAYLQVLFRKLRFAEGRLAPVKVTRPSDRGLGLSW